MPQVAISADFLEAYSHIPKPQQKKVREFTEKFRLDPTQASIHYEPLTHVRDDKVHSVRIGVDYRAIVVHPPKTDVYLCVWVAHHDEAMNWARNKRFDINPVLGSLQVYEVVEGKPAPPPPPVPDPSRLFAGVSDSDLELAGVPEQLVPSVRALRRDGDLDGLAPYLPQEAAEVLYLLASGHTMEQALDELAMTSKRAAAVDTHDFKKALEHPESQRRFHLIDSERELAEMLNAPLALWRRFLHPSQERLVRAPAKGPVQVLGGAGTGKTVVLMHRARHLASEVFKNADDRILVTTLTRNLAADLQSQLKSLCGPEFARLEIVNLHQWAAHFMRNQGVKFSVVDDKTARRYWDEAYSASATTTDLPLGFYRDEWKQVVQAYGVTTREDYLQAPRTGRGTSLVRKQRLAVWKVFEEYRSLLQAAEKVEFADVIRETRQFLEKNPGLLPYRAVLADEVQDFSLAELRLLRTLAPRTANDLFLVGDAHQRIYGNRASLGKAGIEVRGRSKRLYVNYRTTEKIRLWAVALLAGVNVDDLNEGQDTLKGYRSLRAGLEPEVRTFATQKDEGAFLEQRLRQWLKTVPPEEICISARTMDLLTDRFRPVLQKAGIASVIVEKDSDENLGPGVRLATMHRLKGLEFPNVLIAGADKDIVPYPLSGDQIGDASSREDHQLDEKCLLYVAATRARDELVLTACDPACTWLQVADRRAGATAL